MYERGFGSLLRANFSFESHTHTVWEEMGRLITVWDLFGCIGPSSGAEWPTYPSSVTQILLSGLKKVRWPGRGSFALRPGKR
jgi:hypothetical protein